MTKKSLRRLMAEVRAYLAFMDVARDVGSWEYSAYLADLTKFTNRARFLS